MGSFRGIHFYAPSFFIGVKKMKLILKNDNYSVFLANFFGGNLIIVQDYLKRERVYTFAEAKARGIIQKDKMGLKCVMPSSDFGILTVIHFNN